jgi:8-oxo-dGTP pyrophosphatase MutT (NUDIX family)
MKEKAEAFISELSDRLKNDLPAYAAHKKVMAHRKPVGELGETVKRARQSAVLIFLYPYRSQWYTVFIQRSNYRGVHSGQIAFPGGKYEEEDKDLEQTALREAEEEVAIPAKRVNTIGRISSLYVPPSNFLINPYIGYDLERPIFKPEPSEVADILELPLEALIGDHRLQDHQLRLTDGKVLDVKGFPVGDRIIWGATAMILKEFADIVEELKSPIWLK